MIVNRVFKVLNHFFNLPKLQLLQEISLNKGILFGVYNELLVCNYLHYSTELTLAIIFNWQPHSRSKFKDVVAQ